MKTMTAAEFKANFSSVVDELKHGNKVVITYGRKKVPLATIIPQSQLNKPNYSVKIGDLKTQGWTYTLNDFEMTEEELINS
jgi:antitoxin (DNA-binding transcriptional repressor) of toxin-antitoxin stability system